MNRSHVTIVLTNDLCQNIEILLDELKGQWFDVGAVERSWSMVLLNRNNTTIIAIQKIIEVLPQSGKNLFELCNFNDKWDRERIKNEVYKILPYYVIDRHKHLYIIVDKESINEIIVLSHRVLRQIYGLWNTIDEMPDFMIKLKENNAEKCFSFRSELLGKEDILKLVDEDIWGVLSEKINRRVVLADIARYYMMWKQGGFYLDMDIRVNTNLDNIVKENIDKGYTMILFTEHDKCDHLHMGIRENTKHTRRIYNCMFWSEEGNSFWKKCIDLTVKRCKQLIDDEVKMTDEDVLWASGPDVITTIYNEEYNNYSKIKVYNANESDKLLTHLNAGTWRSNKDNFKI